MTAVAVAAYWRAAAAAGELPGGSSPLGFWYGVVAALLIVCAFMYPLLRSCRRAEAWWTRSRAGRAVRRARAVAISWVAAMTRFGRGPAAGAAGPELPLPAAPAASPAYRRLRWHIWLGLLVIPFGLMHSGLWPRQGLSGIAHQPALPAWLYALMLGVVASGVHGLIVQQFLPRLIRDTLANETASAEVRPLHDELLAEADLLVWVALGPAADGTPDGSRQDGGLPQVLAARLRRGAGRGALDLLPELREGQLPLALSDAQRNDAALVRRIYREAIRPHLAAGARWCGPFARPAVSAELFGLWKVGWRTGAVPAPDAGQSAHPRAAALFTALERLCDRRRQLALQGRLHWWLSGWLVAHYGLSVALLGLLAWHVLTATRYW
jgi:hypothetical protein